MRHNGHCSEALIMINNMRVKGGGGMSTSLSISKCVLSDSKDTACISISVTNHHIVRTARHTNYSQEPALRYPVGHESSTMTSCVNYRYDDTHVTPDYTYA